MAVASSTRQSQGGSNVTRQTQAPRQTRTTSREAAATQVTVTESGEEISEAVSVASVARSAQREAVGLSMTITIKIANNPPPKTLAR